MKIELKLFLALIIIYAYFTHTYISTNDASRLALTAALVEEHKLTINPYLSQIISPLYNPLDYAEYGGNIYSDKAPLGSFLALPVYAFARFFTDNYNVIGYLCSLVISGGSTALTAVLLFDIGKYFKVEERWRIIIALLYGLGTNAFYWATVFFSHALTSFLGFASFYLLYTSNLKEKADGKNNLKILGAGMLAGAGVASDYFAILTLIALSCYCFWVFRLNIFSFLAGAFIPLLFLGIYHTLLFGTPFVTPYQYQGVFGDYHQQGLVGISLPTFKNFVTMLIGSRVGLFWFNPILILGLWAVIASWRSIDEKPIKYLMNSLILFYFIFNSSIQDWVYGASWGPRYLTPIFPFLIIAIYNYDFQGWKKHIFNIIALITVLLNFSAVNQAFLPPSNLRYPLSQQIIPQTLEYGSFNILSWILFYSKFPLIPNPTSAIISLLPLAIALILIFKKKK